MLLEEVDPKINTCVYQIKDIEFPNIIAVGKSNIVDFWVFFLDLLQLTGCEF